MSVQLVVYPQSSGGVSSSYNIPDQMVVNGGYFNLMQGPYQYPLPASTLAEQAIAALSPIIQNTWYSLFTTQAGTVAPYTAANGTLLLLAKDANAIMQRLSSLVEGAVYTLKITYASTGNFDTTVKIFNGTTLSSTLSLVTPNIVETVQFTAPSVNDTIISISPTVPPDSNYLILRNISVIRSSSLVGQEICDLYEDEDLPLTLSVDDFKNVAETVHSYSKAFNLPNTKNNNRIFNAIFDITRSADGLIFNPYKRTRCTLKQDSFTLFDGFLRLLDVSDKNGEISYNVNMYSEVVALADTLGDRTLSNFDFSELNHLYNYDNIKLSWSNITSVVYENAADSGFRDNNTLKYPFVNWEHQYTVDSFGNPVLPSLESTFRPFINIKYLIDRIFEETDFSYTSDFFDTNDFKNLFMDFNWGANANPNTQLNNGFAQYFANATPDNYATTAYTNLQWVDNSLPSIAGFDPSTNIFTCPAGQTNSFFQMSYSVKVFAKRDANIEFRWIKNRLTNPEIFDQVGISPVISLNGSALATFTGQSGATFVFNIIDGGYYPGGVAPTVTLPSAFGSGTTFTATLTGTAVTSITAVGGSGYFGTERLVFNGVDPIYLHSGVIVAPMEPGDTLELQWKASNSNYIRQDNSPANNDTTTTIQPTSSLVVYITATGIANDALLQNLRGEIGQWEFLKGLITMFNLVTLPDPSNPINIIIEPYADVFVNNTSDPLDWTEKIDAAEMKLTPLIDLKRQTIFKFAEDEDDYPFNNMSKITNKLYGSKTFPENPDLQFNLLEGKEEIIAEPFSATVVKPLMPQYSDLIIPCLYSYDPETDTTEGFDNSPRIMYNNGLKILSSTTYNVPGQNNVAGVPYEDEFLQFSNLSTIPGLNTSVDFHFGEGQTLPGVGYTLKNLFNLYWLPYYAELYNPDTRLMTIKVNLTPADINSFLFNSKVLIKNRIFRVNKIDYKPNDLATVEFILIP